MNAPGVRQRAVERLAGSPLEGPARRLYSLIWEHVPDAVLSAVAIKGRNYDRMTLRIAARALAGGGSAVDIGAHQGDILKALVRMSPGPHWAFEPTPAFAARLRRRFPQVTVEQAALSDFCGTAEFRYLPGAPGYSSLLTRPHAEAGRAVRSLRVQVRRLDDCIPGDMHVAFVKIDVEDAEAAVLRGARELLRRCQPVVVFECASARLPDCVAALDGTGLGVSFLVDFLAGVRRPAGDVLRLGRERGEYYYAAGPH
jgi:FkbM family methyltransferase